MFSKANIVSTLVTAIWAYFGGWLIWGMLMDPILADYTSSAGSDVMREMPDTIHLIIGCVLFGFIFSTIYSKWGNENYSAFNGLTYGIWIGLLFGLGEGMVDFAVSDMMANITGVLIGAVTCLVFYGIMGLLAGIVYKKMS